MDEQAEQHEVSEAWLKEARKAWVASLPSPTELGNRGLAKCGDYADPKDRPEGRRLYMSSCYHSARYATSALRWISDPGPMRFYCGTHANEIARRTIQFPHGAEGDAIYRERIENFDERRNVARM